MIASTPAVSQMMATMGSSRDPGANGAARDCPLLPLAVVSRLQRLVTAASRYSTFGAATKKEMVMAIMRREAGRIQRKASGSTSSAQEASGSSGSSGQSYYLL